MHSKKLILFLPLFFIFFVLSAQDKKTSGIKWVTIEEAQALGKKIPKKIFVDTYTDWCGWCKVMDKKTFADPDVADFVNKHYYAVKLNAEGSNNITFNGQVLTEAQLARSFKVSGYPTIVFIDEKFENVTPIPGYQPPTQFLQILKEFKEIK